MYSKQSPNVHPSVIQMSQQLDEYIVTFEKLRR
ncbi:aspartyl-phosphate phosphatase Spo0E family protein [Brevibacillus laterosporus]|nr:aspartyl-phosphate phosphatase Spo0E family protein [Brevibacillus laterosporus]MED4766159.1 aspartyl-phosphate phosphatase Spo0E family protein [Brevibacillus laterosporus]